MIRRVFAVNFRSLGAVELALGDLTAIVGPNGAGKSNALDALRFLSDAVRHGLEVAVAERQGFAALQRSSRDRPRDVELSLDAQAEDTNYRWRVSLAQDPKTDFRVRVEYCLSLPSSHLDRGDAQWRNVLSSFFQQVENGGSPEPLATSRLPAHASEYQALLARWGAFELKEGVWLELPPNLSALAPFSTGRFALPEVAKLDARFRPLIDEISRIAVYSLFPPTLRQPQNPDSTRPMRRHGENWASTLRALDREREGAELLAALGRIVGDIDDYRVTAVGGFLIPEFRHGVHNGRERWFGAAQESDGTLRLAALLTALLQDPAPSLIGIEEPELAVHPGALPILVDYLKEASRRTQVVITTHSPELLDLLPPESLRVVERVDGATTVRGLAADQKDLLRRHLYSTSELLRAEGLRGEPGEGAPSLRSCPRDGPTSPPSTSSP